MGKSVGTFALIIAVLILGPFEFGATILIIFALLTGLCYVLIRIIHSDERPEKPPETTAINVHPRGFIDERAKMIDEWVWSQNRNHPEQGYIDWEFTDLSGEMIEFTPQIEGVTYIGKVFFAEKNSPEFLDQPRVLKVESTIKGTEITREWEGMELKRVPLESIQKNIQNSFKNDKKLRKILEEAFDECLDKGVSVVELDDVNLDFNDNRVKTEFMKKCRESGNFSSVHLLDNGHQLEVYVGEMDPV